MSISCLESLDRKPQSHRPGFGSRNHPGRNRGDTGEYRGGGGGVRDGAGNAGECRNEVGVIR